LSADLTKKRTPSDCFFGDFAASGLPQGGTFAD